MARLREAARLASICIDKCSGIAGGVAGICYAALMCIMTFEVIMRYVFNAPTTWVAHTSQWLMGLCAAFSWSYAMREGGHIRLDLLIRRLSPRKRKMCLLSTLAAPLLFLIILAWESWELTYRSMAGGYLCESTFPLPLWVPQIFLFIGSLLFVFQTVSEVMKLLQSE